MKKLPTTESVQILKKNAEAIEPFRHQYAEGTLPIHGLLKITDGNLAYNAYDRWSGVYNYPLFWSYGGRPSSFVDSLNKDRQVMRIHS